MKYFPIFNQTKALEWQLNTSEALIFQLLTELPSWADSVIINGNIWYFAAREKLCEEMPIVTQKPDTMYRILKSLQDKGLIENTKINRVDFIRFTTLTKDWKNHGKFSEQSEKNPSNHGKFSESNSEKNPTYNIYHKDNNKTNDNDNHFHKIFTEKNDLGVLEVEEKKAPQTRGARAKKVKAPFCTFEQSPFYDFEAFKDFMKDRYPEADPNYYYIQVRDWEQKDGSKPERQNWKNTIRQFISNDIQSGKLKTSKQYAEQKPKYSTETSQLISDFFGS